jgi:HEAT repeat protein
MEQLMNRKRIAANLALAFLSTGCLTASARQAQGSPQVPASIHPNAENAKIEERRLTGSLEQTVDAWAKSADRPQWLAYAVPALSSDHQICFGGDWNGSSCDPCRLEGSGHGDNFNLRSSRAVLESPQRLLVLYRAEGRKVDKIRLVSAECTLDAGGLQIVWLTEVNPAQSVSLLEKFVDGKETDEHGGGQLSRSALMAIALTGDAAADQAFLRFTSASQPEQTRREATFWAGEARGTAGVQLLKRMAREDPSPEVRAQVAFALSISHENNAIDEMIRMAHEDSSGHVRGQALFWLAQKAGNQAAGTIAGAIDNDPDTEVKKKAVFALSQLPKDDGVPKLIHVAETNRSPEVRKQAMFWLGQSNDPRALDFFEKVLGK